MSSFRALDRVLHQPQPRGRHVRKPRAVLDPRRTRQPPLTRGQNYLSIRRQSLEGRTATAGLRTIASKAELATNPAAELGSRKLRLSRQQPADPLQRLRHAQTLLDKILRIPWRMHESSILVQHIICDYRAALARRSRNFFNFSVCNHRWKPVRHPAAIRILELDFGEGNMRRFRFSAIAPFAAAILPVLSANTFVNAMAADEIEFWSAVQASGEPMPLFTAAETDKRWTKSKKRWKLWTEALHEERTPR